MGLVAAISVGMSGADVEQVARGARRTARRQGRKIEFADLFREITGPLPEPGDRALWPVAVHEAAHAIATATYMPGWLLAVTLFAPGEALGQTIRRSGRSMEVTSRSIDNELVLLLAGRAAEEAILGEITAGAGGGETSDLARATLLAFTAEANYGLGTDALLWTKPPELSDLHKRMAAQPEATKAAEARLARAYQDAKRFVYDARPVIEALAEQLLLRFVMTNDDVMKIMAEHGCTE